MTHELAANENFDIVRGKQTLRMPFDATDPAAPTTNMFALLSNIKVKSVKLNGVALTPDANGEIDIVLTTDDIDFSEFPGIPLTNVLLEILDNRAPLDSPAFTGTPTAPTPTAQSGNTQVATKGYVDLKTTGGAEYATITIIALDGINLGPVTVSGKNYTPIRQINSFTERPAMCIPVKTTDTVSVEYNNYQSDCFIYKNGVAQSSVPSTLTAGDAWVIAFAACLSPDTPITMADGTVKRLNEVEVDDMVCSIDPETGELSSDRVTKVSQGVGKFRDIWTFEDGRTVTTVGRHRFWNADLGEFMYMEAWNNGERARTIQDGYVRLVRHVREDGEFAHATLFTEKWNNYFAGGLLAGNRNSVKGEM